MTYASHALVISVLVLLPLSAVAHQLEPLVFENLHLPHTVTRTDAVPPKIGSAELLFSSGRSRPINSPCGRLVIVGSAADTGWTVEARIRQPGGDFPGWFQLERKTRVGGRFWARLVRTMETGSTVEIRILSTSGTLSVDPGIFLQMLYAVPQEVREEPATPHRGKPGAFLAPGCVTPPPLVNRDQWGALPPAGTQIPHSPYRFTLHHTALNRCTTLAQGIAEMRFIQDLHTNGNGWKDIGYHFLVDDEGRIYGGVPDTIVGTHAANANTGNIGVSMMGLFTGVRPPDPMLAACESLYSFLTEKFGINPDSLFGHRDYVVTTTCPGDSGYARLVSIRDDVRRAVACGGPYVTDPYPKPFSRNVDVNTQIRFHLRDDPEGINPSTVKIFIDGVLTPPSGVSGNPRHYYVLINRSVPFPPAREIHVIIQAEDLAPLPNQINYAYSFTTQAPAVIAETHRIDSMSNATLVLQGSWIEQMFKASVPGVTGTTSLVSYGLAGEISARFYPHIPRSGNYAVNMAVGGMLFGPNFRYRTVSSDGRINEVTAEYNQSFFNTWGALGRGPVYFAAGSPSSGYVELLPAVNHPSVLILDAVRFEERDSLEVPALVDLQYVMRHGADRLAVGWLPSLDHGVCGYRVYLSSDGRSWGAPAADEAALTRQDTVWTFLPPDPEAPAYVRVSAVKCLGADSAGGPAPISEGPPSDVYGASLRGEARILVVDNFDRQASWMAPSHFFVRSYGDAVASYGAGFESCANDAVQAGAVSLPDFDAVVYFCGDDSDRDESVSETELLMLLEYLEGGGKLFVSGSEIAYDLGRPGRPDVDIFGYLFRAEYAGDDAGNLSCQGASGALFDGLTFDYGTETDETYTEDWPDYILPRGGAEPVLYYTGSSNVAAVAFTGVLTPLDSTSGRWINAKLTGADSVARIVYCAFPVETIVLPGARAEVVARVLTYFGIPSIPLSVTEGEIPGVFSLAQNYPNPFNPSTTIRYTLPGLSDVTLRVYDLLGREVALLVRDRQPAGRYEVRFDTHGLATGTYVCRLQAGSFVEARRMLLLK